MWDIGFPEEKSVGHEEASCVGREEGRNIHSLLVDNLLEDNLLDMLHLNSCCLLEAADNDKLVLVGIVASSKN